MSSSEIHRSYESMKKATWRKYTTSQSTGHIAINISGELYETYDETLKRFPNTLLGNSRKRSRHYCAQTGEYFFDRNRSCFDSILFFYQSNGTLNCPVGTSISLFEDECRYFQLPIKYIHSMKRKEGIFPELIKDDREKESSTETPKWAKNANNVPFKHRMWSFLDDPTSSTLAWYFGILSLILVFASAIIEALETIRILADEVELFATVELLLNTWFLLEIILRLLSCEDVCHFLRGYMNIVDIVSVIPYFLVLFMHTAQGNDYHHTRGLIGFVKTLKFLRVCRLFRFSRHSKRLVVVVKILQSCFGSFQMLMLCLLIITILGGTIIFVFEERAEASTSVHQTEVGFESIPDALWWSIITVTTIGYGDMIPGSVFGRVFASCFMLVGVATTALPILTIVTQFVKMYPQNIDLVTNKQEKVGGNANAKLNLMTGRTKK